MILSKTPLRMSYVGGGSDLPSFYKNSEGAVLSSAINKFIYVHIILFIYKSTEESWFLPWTFCS